MAEFIKVTEQTSTYNNLEKMSIQELLVNINKEDKTVPLAVEKAIPQIEKLCAAISDKMLAGGRLFYIGAGTSGRLGIVDASECPPTFGVPYGLVIGLIAGGDKAITQAVEFAEDNTEQGWNDLVKHFISDKDVVVGLAASGTTPYVIGALKECRKKGIITGSVCCNPNSPVSAEADFPIEVVVGPEFVTGSTRMKSGTAQKLVLNMISTSIMIQLGRVENNKMVNMQLSNVKLVDRGVKMLMESLKLTDYEYAKELLLKYGSVKKAVESVIPFLAMHDIEPFFNWRHIYIAEEDPLSPFMGRSYSEFEYSQTVYNYYIHPQWDDFGSRTLYLKIIYVDYELNFAIIELIGEWNDAIENDIMELKREILDLLYQHKIYKYILIAENVLNFHSSDKEYYQEWYEELSEVNGWAVILNMPEATQQDFKKKKLQYYIELMELIDWRVYKPYHLFKKIDEVLMKRLD